MAVTNKVIPRREDAAARGIPETASQRRLKYGLSIGILLLSLLLILGVLNWLASDAAHRMDLTTHGRYSISGQTLNLLKTLEDKVTITMLFAESDPTLNSDQQRVVKFQRSEVEDVLRELRNKSDKIEVVLIDPTDPRTVKKYDDLVGQLKSIYKDESAAYEQAAQAGRAALESLSTFASAEAEGLISTVGDLPPDHASFRDFQAVIQILSNIPREVESVEKTIDESLDDSPMMGRPFPDLQGAVSIVQAAAKLRGGTVTQIADFLEKLIGSGTLPETLATKLRDTVTRCRDTATALAAAADKIGDLKPLQLSSINAALRSRNCVLLTSNTRAAVLPYNRLFPPPGAQQAAEEGLGGLRRFAGETVLASGIRQLSMTERPKVVLCHAEPMPSILTGRPGGPDLASVADQLTDLGFEVMEWNVNGGPRPVIEQQTGKPVWVIVPPAPTGEMAMSGGELADAATALVAEGANVMIGFFPSFIAQIGQADPWNAAIEPLGVSADTARLIVEKIPGPNGQDQYPPSHDFVDFLSDNPIATAVRGEPTQLDLVVPLVVSQKPQVATTTLLELKPSDRLWATADWRKPETKPSPPDVAPYPVVVASERNDTFGLQRALIIGSARWCWTGIAGQYDFASQLPMYPGNSELFSAGVCWLAHLDDLIARSPRAESVARIENLSSGGQLFWRWALIGGLPVLSLIAGVVVTVSRRG